jgi:rRNA processing protein Krr1/Pno1
MLSTSAEEALSRAKAIAARLSGEEPEAPAATATTTTTTTTTTGSKRKRWGVAPPVAAVAVAPVAAEALPGLADAAKKLKQSAEPVSRRFWVPTSKERTEAHFLSYLTPRLKMLIQQVGGGAGGAGKKDDTAAALTLKLVGRGSSGLAPLAGMPEEPMCVTMIGSAELVEQAEPLVDTLLREAAEAPVEAFDAPPPTAAAIADAQAASDNGGPSAALALLPQSGGYRPATVAQLIANSQNPMAGGAGGGGGDLMEEQIGIPNGVVGFIIGRGGETIASLQARTGCKIQIQKEHELTHGQTQRVITLCAATQDAIDECRGMITTMVQERVRAAGGGSAGVTGGSGGGGGAMGGGQGGGGGSKEGKVNEALAEGHQLVQVDVPDADVGLIIGKGGATIKMIQESTGSSIQIPPSGNVDNPSMRTVSITHPTEQGAHMARQQIEELLKSKPSYAGGQNSQHAQSSQLSIQLMVSISYRTVYIWKEVNGSVASFFFILCVSSFFESPFSFLRSLYFNIHRFPTRMSVCALEDRAVSFARCNVKQILVFRSRHSQLQGNLIELRLSPVRKTALTKCKR